MDLEKVNNAREFLTHALRSVSEIGKILTISSEKLLNTKVVYADMSTVDNVVKANEKIKKMVAIAKLKLDDVQAQSTKDLQDLLTSMGIPVEEPGKKLPNGDTNGDSSINNSVEEDKSDGAPISEPEGTVDTVDKMINDKTTSDDKVTSDDKATSDNKATEDRKGFIKVVDITKLMEPKKTESVIVISDTDVSSPEKPKPKPKLRPRSKTNYNPIQSIYQSDPLFKPKSSFIKLNDVTCDIKTIMHKNRIQKVFDPKGNLLQESISPRSRSSKELAKSRFESYRKTRTERRKKPVPEEECEKDDSDADTTIQPVPEFDDIPKPDIKSSLKDLASPKVNKRVSFASGSSTDDDDDKAKENSNCDDSKNDDESARKTRATRNERNKKSSLRQIKKNEDSKDSDSDSNDDKTPVDDSNIDISSAKAAEGVEGEKEPQEDDDEPKENATEGDDDPESTQKESAAKSGDGDGDSNEAEKKRTLDDVSINIIYYLLCIV